MDSSLRSVDDTDLDFHSGYSLRLTTRLLTSDAITRAEQVTRLIDEGTGPASCY